MISMFGFKKPVHYSEANNFLHREFRIWFPPLSETLATNDAANFHLSNTAVDAIARELLFFFIHIIRASEGKYTNMHLEDLLKRLSSHLKEPIDLKEVQQKLPEIDEVMQFAAANAQNSGGVGAAIITYIICNLPQSTLKEINIIRVNELEVMLGIEIGEENDNDVIALYYLSALIGPMVGELIATFNKNIDDYFQKHTIKDNS